MDAKQYAKRFRVIGMVSFFFGAILAVIMVYCKLVATPELAIGIGLVLAIVPLVIFRMRNKPMCEKCGGKMKISKGFPNIVYKCKSCGEVVDTGLHSDY
jgi:tRNA(Ile2) C34 agmatinyltransferase TiaS